MSVCSFYPQESIKFCKEIRGTFQGRLRQKLPLVPKHIAKVERVNLIPNRHDFSGRISHLAARISINLSPTPSILLFTGIDHPPYISHWYVIISDNSSSTSSTHALEGCLLFFCCAFSPRRGGQMLPWTCRGCQSCSKDIQ